ncbi:Arm DNA-binding domain-containing protein [Gammaproteobacteria bacterium]|nr:Arm DNA-binding domain-containing protein [Gammaproteobacteria bacterium]MDC1391616.1 Arm DNA-binding domain-containing protein [Gammaproteobacteria bacterium]
MAGEKLLSETACKAAKPTTNMYYLNDGAGLRLRCRPNGSRTWIYRYRINGHEKSIGLGSYPQVSLRIARIKAAESSALVIYQRKAGAGALLLERKQGQIRARHARDTVKSYWSYMN